MEDTPIVQKMYDFYRDFYNLASTMPKQDRHALGEKIQKTSIELIELLVYASRKDRKSKFYFLEEAAAKLDLLKLLLRLGEDIQSIPTKRYIALSEKLQEIGRMLGGWIRSLN